MAKPKKRILGLERRTFVALVVFVLCGGGAAAALMRPKPGEKAVERAFKAFDQSVVDHMDITSGGKTTSFARTGDTWSVTAPTPDKADQDAVKSFVGRLATVTFEGVVADQESSQAGYEVNTDKGVRVVAKQGDTVLCDFVIGKEDGRMSYLRPSDGTDIYAVSGIARYDVQKDPNAWRDHTMFPQYKSDDVAEIDVATPAGTTVVKKAASSASQPAYQATWNVESSPIPSAELGTLDTTIAPGIAGALIGLHATDIADGVSAADAGLSPPQGTVTLVLADGTKYVLNVGKAKDDQNRYASTPSDSRIFLLPQSTLDRVYVTPQQFRAKDMANVKAEDVSEIDLTNGTDKTVLVRDTSGDWKAQTPADAKIDATKVNGVVGVLDGLKGAMFSDVTDVATTGLDKPTTVATFKMKAAGDPPITINVGKAQGSQYTYATISTHPNDVYLLYTYTANRLQKKASDFTPDANPGPGAGGPPPGMMPPGMGGGVE
jgi:hypothetical protein